MQLTESEENYLKAIFSLSYPGNESVSTNAIAKKMNTAAASVTDMLKKLSDKNLVEYEKYKGVALSNEGQVIARRLVRKHRIWEVFLVEKLGFSWDEVHEVAEQLEHIDSAQLVNKLDKFLGYPKTDPHGDPIPDEDGNIHEVQSVKLTELQKGDVAIVVGVDDTSSALLQYLNQLDIELGLQLEVLQKVEFDYSFVLKCKNRKISISKQVAENIMVRKV
jgi:DtxR family transcriptional regulator, Mn-dependent transcriptional regulator